MDQSQMAGKTKKEHPMLVLDWQHYGSKKTNEKRKTTNHNGEDNMQLKRIEDKGLKHKQANEDNMKRNEECM